MIFSRGFLLDGIKTTSIKMELSLVLERLKATIEKMKTLKNTQFHYSVFVSKYDEKSECGTVCCVAGWYGNWFKEHGFFYYQENHFFDFRSIGRKTESGVNYEIGEILGEYHGLSYSIISTLFYGKDLRCENGTLVDNSILNGLPNVIRVFERVYELLEKEVITPEYDFITEEMLDENEYDDDYE